MEKPRIQDNKTASPLSDKNSGSGTSGDRSPSPSHNSGINISLTGGVPRYNTQGEKPVGILQQDSNKESSSKTNGMNLSPVCITFYLSTNPLACLCRADGGIVLFPKSLIMHCNQVLNHFVEDCASIISFVHHSNWGIWRQIQQSICWIGLTGGWLCCRLWMKLMHLSDSSWRSRLNGLVSRAASSGRWENRKCKHTWLVLAYYLWNLFEPNTFLSSIHLFIS